MDGFCLEYSKSARAACPLCGESIAKGIVRVGKEGVAAGAFKTIRWHHPKCFTDNYPENDLTKISGFGTLKVVDQIFLKSIIASKDVVKSEVAENCLEPVSPKGVVMTPKFSTELKAFQRSQLSTSYRNVPLPEGWKAFSTVICYEAENLEPSQKIAAFDFDGTLVNTHPARHGPDAWKLLYPSVSQKLAYYHNEGYKLVIFSNESNIDRWVNKRASAIRSKVGRLEGLMKAVKLPLQIFVACGTGTTNDSFRKPAIGMWNLLEDHLNGGVCIDKERSFYVGDAAGRQGKIKDHSRADIDFAKALGLKFLLPEDVFCDSPSLGPPAP